MKLLFNVIKINTCAALLLLGVPLYSLPALQASAQTRVNRETAILPLDPAVRTGKLPNGFTYYIRHNEEPKNRVVFYLANKVGSVLESDDQRGLAHFMEHMSFNGTKHFPKSALVDYLQKSGVRFGADLNAYTAFDETVYQLPLPSDNPEILKNGLQIMRDWAQEATLDATEIDKERGVVLEEKRLGRGAQERLQRVTMPLLLNNSRYAVRLPIGTEEVLTKFKPEVIRRFYKDWYRPDLQALIVVGDIDVNEMEKKVRAQFSGLKNPANERARTRYSVPLTGSNQFVALTDKEVTTTSAEVLIKHPGLTIRTAADYRQAIARELFNQLLAARYAELSLQADPPFVQASAGIEGLLGGLDVYGASVVVKPGQLETGVKALWRETIRAKRFGFTATELERAKQAYLSQFEAALKEKDKTPSESFVKEYLQYFLKGDAAPGIQAEYALVKKALPEITAATLNKIAADYITDGNRDVILTAPEKDKSTLPAAQTLYSWLKAAEAEQLLPYQDKVSTLSFLTSEPVAGKVVAEQKDENLGLTTLTLSNGAKVILKPTTFKNNEIRFSAFAAGGTSLYDEKDFQSAANAASMVPAFGAGNYSVTELQKFLSGKQVQVQPFISERYQGVNGAAVPQDLETALQLTYAYFTEPGKDTSVFKGIMQRSRVMLENRMNDPASVFQDSVAAILGAYNFRRTGPSPEKLAQIDPVRMQVIYRERFADASAFTFIFTGSFDPKTIRPLLEKYIGSLPATHQQAQARDLGIHIPAGVIEKNIYKGSEPKATARLVFSGEFPWSPENALTLEAMKECLEIRLLERLREEESGVYTPGVQAQAVKLPHGRFTFTILFGCAPQNTDKLIQSALDEVRKLRQFGPSQVNLDKFKAETARTRELQLKTNAFWNDYLMGQLSNSEPLNEVFHYDDMVKAITPAKVRSLAEKCLSGDNQIRLVLLPETK